MSGIPEQAVPGEHGSGAGQWWVCGRLWGGRRWSRGLVDAKVWLLRMIGGVLAWVSPLTLFVKSFGFAAGRSDLS